MEFYPEDSTQHHLHHSIYLIKFYAAVSMICLARAARGGGMSYDGNEEDNC